MPVLVSHEHTIWIVLLSQSSKSFIVVWVVHVSDNICLQGTDIEEPNAVASTPRPRRKETAVYRDHSTSALVAKQLGDLAEAHAQEVRHQETKWWHVNRQGGEWGGKPMPPLSAAPIPPNHSTIIIICCCA